MAIIRIRQIHEMSEDDLRKRLAELKMELSKERAQIAVGGSPSNTGRVSETRKTMARILTELKQRKKKKEAKTTGSM
ncbi:MAG: 50S ribosomal protein L29 [Candidatus Aenigmatarchaeota archaeon]